MDSARAHLYDLADELYGLAPWEWMSEVQLVGVCHPETGELARMSIMGSSGTHCSLALYLGADSLHRFNLIQEGEAEGIDLTQEDTVELILESRQLQASFGRRDELYPDELLEIKALGRRYRGNNWPNFRSFRPGWAPQPAAGDDETAWLATAMEQMLVVAPKLRNDRFGDYRHSAKGGIEHIARRQGKDGKWRTVWVPWDGEQFQLPRPEPGEFFAERVAALPASQLQIECQFQLLPCMVGVPGKSATYPYVCMSVDSVSGSVVGMELLSVESQAHEELIASVPEVFLRQWIGVGRRPAGIRVATATTYALLERTAAAVGIPIQRKKLLPALDQALSSILDMVQGEE